MNLIIKKENYEICDLLDWKDYAGPVLKEQWVDKRSAKEFARYMLSNNGKLPPEFSFLNAITHDENFVLFPEYLTGFKKYGLGFRGPRHHDGLLVSNDTVVGIEAKADEPLDSKYLSEYDCTKERYIGISKYIFGDLPDKHNNIRYQLVSASMATLIEAHERNKRNAVLLIISFLSKEKTTKDNIERNRKDIDSFKKALIHISGDEYEVPFSKDNKINFFIKQIDIVLDKNN